MREYPVMRFRGVFDRAFSFACVLSFALALAACSGQVEQPKEYELGAPAAVTPGGVAAFSANSGDLVHFQADSAALSPGAKTVLRQQIRWLNQHPEYRVTVEGHADEWGTRQHNLSVGAARATAVKTFLLENGLRSGPVHTVSYGKERLVADCTTLDCRAQNRRARTVLSAETAAQ
jgi:peptidoglycan-associated lipoprotein